MVFSIATKWVVTANERTMQFAGKKANGSISGLTAEIVFDQRQPDQSGKSATIDATNIANNYDSCHEQGNFLWSLTLINHYIFNNI